MNYDPKNASRLLKDYLDSAGKRLESAKALIEIGNYEDSISRSYYAILDAATACLIKKDVIPKSHAGAIKLFSLHYIKPGLVDKKYQRQFAMIEKARIEADYTHTRKFSKGEAVQIYEEAEGFVQMSSEIVS